MRADRRGQQQGYKWKISNDRTYKLELESGDRRRRRLPDEMTETQVLVFRRVGTVLTVCQDATWPSGQLLRKAILIASSKLGGRNGFSKQATAPRPSARKRSISCA
jgi:hypothetical protein